MRCVLLNAIAYTTSYFTGLILNKKIAFMFVINIQDNNRVILQMILINKKQKKKCHGIALFHACIMMIIAEIVHVCHE